jgi:branched-chain amino acid transport system permease protein
MKTSPIRNSISLGITFAVIIIFLALISFHVTGSVLVAKLLGNPPVSGKIPAVGYLVTFFSLVGLWMGILASRPQTTEDSVGGVIRSSLTAGAVTGSLVALFSLIFSNLLAQKIDPRASLAMVSPDTMRYFLFNQPGVAAFFYHLLLLVITSLLGGLLAFYLRRAQFWPNLRRGWGKLVDGVQTSGPAAAFRRSPYAVFILYALVAALMFFLPRQWGSYWNYIIGTVGIYVILGLGLNIIVGLAGQLVLGYVAFFAIGAYSVALLTAPQPHGLMLNFWIVLIIGVVLSALTGILLGLPILRLRGDYLAIVTLGFGEIIRILLRSDLLGNFTAGPQGVRDIGGPTLFGRPFTSDVAFMYLIFVAMLVIIFFTNRLQNSRTGRAWVAIREDEVAARAAGINAFQSKLLALAIGAAFAGLGGVLFASRNQFTGPEDHTLMVSINVLALVIVGGMGSIPGIILGAFALKGLPEILRELDIYRLMVFGGLLVVMMILRPEGLWPATRPRLEDQAADLQGRKTPEAVQPTTKVESV